MMVELLSLVLPDSDVLAVSDLKQIGVAISPYLLGVVFSTSRSNFSDVALFATQARRTHGRLVPPLILLSGDVNEAQHFLGESSAFDFALTKPLDIDLLVECLTSDDPVVQRSRCRQSLGRTMDPSQPSQPRITTISAASLQLDLHVPTADRTESLRG